MKTAIEVKAKLICVLSDSGKMASYVSKFRPNVSVLCVTPDLVAARQASGLLLGMHTIWVDSIAESDEIIEEVSYELTESGMVKMGDKMIVLAGRMAGMKEQMKVVELSKGFPHGHIKEGGGFYFNRKLLLNYSTN